MEKLLVASDKKQLILVELKAIAQRLYLLELATRAANRVGNKQRLDVIEKELTELLVANDVFTEELATLDVN